MAKTDLEQTQYKDSANLAKRANLHAKYGSGNWYEWLAAQGNFAEGNKVLDIGCGPGWFWATAADKLPEGLDVTLADTSEGMVGEALERVQGVQRWNQVTGITADVCKLPFADDSFDAVLAIHMLYHADDPAVGVAEIARVLKPGATALISTNSIRNFQSLAEIGNEAFGVPDWDPATKFGLESGKPIVESSFSNVELCRQSHVLRVDDAVDLFAYLTSFPPGITATDEQKQVAIDLVEKGLRAGNGIFEVPVEMGVFVCSND